ALEPGDSINIPMANQELQRVRIKDILRSRPLIEIEGVLEDISIHDLVGDANGDRDVGGGQVAPATLGSTALHLLDLPPLRNVEEGFVLYAGASRSVRSSSWPN